MSDAVALQDAIVAALLADAGVSALVGSRVYNNAPVGVAYPYVTLGPWQELEDDATCITGTEHAIQIDVWTQQGGSTRSNKELCGAVKAALHGADLALPDPYALVLLNWASSRQVGDPDEMIAHGVMSFEAFTEDQS